MLHDLPNEIIVEHILPYLCNNEVTSVRATSKHLKELTSSDHVWKPRFLKLKQKNWGKHVVVNTDVFAEHNNKIIAKKHLRRKKSFLQSVLKHYREKASKEYKNRIRSLEKITKKDLLNIRNVKETLDNLVRVYTERQERLRNLHEKLKKTQ